MDEESLCMAGWLIPSEVHDLHTRSAGQSITVFTQLLSGAIVTQVCCVHLAAEILGLLPVGNFLVWQGASHQNLHLSVSVHMHVHWVLSASLVSLLLI